MSKWDPIDSTIRESAEDTRPSLTYMQDVWRRFRSNVIAMLGLVMLTIIILLAIFGPMLSPFSYSTQNREFGNIPPRLQVTRLAEDSYVFVTTDFSLVSITRNGHLLSSPPVIRDNPANGYTVYEVDGREIRVNWSFANVHRPERAERLQAGMTLYDIYVDGEQISTVPIANVHNRTYFLGSDILGRDLWTRTLYGARISLTVGIVAALLNAFVGVIYGGISGYEGGHTDNIMMRIADLISSIPTVLLVILITVVLNNTGAATIIIVIGLTFWIGMARQVRGQVMSLKEQEFVLAARALGASKTRIIFKHLVPNALGPIVVSMMMSIPSAIFTESFMSFLGIGVTIPMASWGTLASSGLGAIRSAPYLLVVPSAAIALTMFAFNFVGDGLRDALDPKQRK